MGLPKMSDKKRISGGPSVSSWVEEWWEKEANRVAEEDSLGQASIPTLLTRIAKAQLDLTTMGIERYRQTDKKLKKSSRNGEERKG